MGDPKVGNIGEERSRRVIHKRKKLKKKTETGDMKVGEVVEKILMNEPKVGKSREIRNIWSGGMHET